MARARAAIQAAARNGMAARRQQVAALLHAGFAQRAIAEQLGVSEATVSRDCAVLLAQWRVAAATDYAEVAAARAVGSRLTPVVMSTTQPQIKAQALPHPDQYSTDVPLGTQLPGTSII